MTFVCGTELERCLLVETKGGLFLRRPILTWMMMVVVMTLKPASSASHPKRCEAVVRTSLVMIYARKASTGGTRLAFTTSTIHPQM